MTTFLPSREELLANPPPPLTGRATGEVASMGDIIGAAASSESLETNYWDQEGRTRTGIINDITSRFPPDFFAADVLAEMQQSGFTHDTRRPDLEAKVFEALAAKQAEDPAAWGDITINSVDALDAEVIRIRRQEYEDAQATLNMGGTGAGVAEFLGRGAVAMTDETSLALMPLGGGGGLGSVVLKEAALGGIGEAAILPRMYDQAEKLNIPDPNATAQIAMGATFGAALPVGLRAVGAAPRMAADGVKRYLDLRASRNTPTNLPEGANAAEVEALARDTESALRRGDPVPPASGPGVGSYVDGSESNIAFVQAMMPAAIRASERTGVDPRIIIAQAIQETGWGQHAPNNNYFGIKSHGQAGGSTLATNEVINGETVRVNDSFRGYDSIEASVEGYADFLLANPRYGEMMAAQTLDDQIAALGRSGYATDPNYASSIAALAGRITIDGVQLPASARYSPAGGGANTPTGTRAGYTTPDQVVTPSGTRVDVTYEVVDASLLTRASGDLQPRDRTRAASDAQITQIAAELDPARLMPSAEADRGAPIVGPDNIIESGNGRVAAIQSAAPDRKAAYRTAISEAGFDIPEGIKEPVLVARRTSELSPAARVGFVNDANTSSIARMSATEQAAQDARALSSHTMAQYAPGHAISAPDNTPFTRSFLANLPANERAALTTAEGRLNLDGERRLKQALFARAYGAPDLIAKHAEAADPAMRSLIDALAEAAPAWSALRADIEAGLIKPELDLTDNLLDAVRLIGDARKTASKGGTSTAGAIDDALAQISLDGQTHPLTEALVQIFRKGDRVRPDREITELLTGYTNEARIVGKTDAALFDNELSSGPMEVLDAIQKETDLFAPGGPGTRPRDEALYRQPNRPATQSRSGQAGEPLDTSQINEQAYIDGAQSEGSIAADAQGAADLRAAITMDFDTIRQMPDVAKALDDMAAIERTDLAPNYGTPEYWDNREFSINGKKTLGKDDAIDYLYGVARTLAWAEDGLTPQKKLNTDHIATILIGAPASGKSTVANPIARDLGAAIVDADEAKKIIPEFQGGVGANAVHGESSYLNADVLDQFMEAGSNVVLPKVGNKQASIEALVERLKSAGYTVNLVSIDVAPTQAWERMIGRFRRTGRIIDPEYMRDAIDAPRQTYQTLKENGNADSYAQIDNSPALGQPRGIIEDQNGILPSELADSGADGANRSGPLQRGKLEDAAGGNAGTQSPPRQESQVTAARDTFSDDFEIIGPDGQTYRASEILDDLDADANVADIINLCNPKGGA